MKLDMEDIISWSYHNSDELVLVYASHFDGASGCEQASYDLLISMGIYTINDCTELKTLSFNEAKRKGTIINHLGQKGHVIAVMNCMNENYDPSITCYDETYVCYESWPANSTSIPFEKLNNYVLTTTSSSNRIVSNSSSLWMVQFHWQSDAASVILGTLHNSSIIEDVNRSNINLYIESYIYSKQMKYIFSIITVCKI